MFQLLAVIVVASIASMVLWSFSSWNTARELTELKLEPWPSDATKSEKPNVFSSEYHAFSYLKENWNAPDIEQVRSGHAYNFWYLPAFSEWVFVHLEVTKLGGGKVVVKRSKPTMNLSPSNTQEISFYIAPEKSSELLDILARINFWQTPPGKRNHGCLDGESFVVEAARDGKYRRWDNACEASPAMSEIAAYFLNLNGSKIESS